MEELKFSKKRLESIITKYNIDIEHDKVFKAIIKLFNGQTDYQIWALKQNFGGHVPILRLKQIKQWADENPTDISKLSLGNIISYKTPESVEKLGIEMENIDAFHFVKNVVNKFNTAQRQLITNEILEPLANQEYKSLNTAQFRQLYSLLKDFNSIPLHRQQKFISLMSAVYSIDAILKHLKNALNESYEWNREDLLSFASRQCKDTDVCFDDNNIVVLRVPSFESSTKLCGGGRTAWCLTRDRSYFTRYTQDNGNAQQFFLFNFNYPEKHDLSHVGFSVNPNEGINYAHSTRNNSLMGKIEVDHEKWDIHKVLKHCNITKNVYIRLKKLTNYSWDANDFLAKLMNLFKNVQLSTLADGRIIVPCNENAELGRFIFSHTLCNTSMFHGDNKIFVVMDFSKTVDDEDSLSIVSFGSDKYGTLSFQTLYCPYGTHTNEISALKKKGLSTTDFVGDFNLEPNILLHKLIDEENIQMAIELLESNPDVDPNFVFYASRPPIKAIAQGHIDLFTALLKHPKIDLTLTEGFGEPYTHFLLIYAAEKLHDGKSMEDVKAWINMCLTILENKKFDPNCRNLHDDTTLHEACELSEFMPIVEYLISRTDVDINAVNAWGYTPLDVALDGDVVNIEAIKALLQRDDLIISDKSYELAKEQGIDLNQLRHEISEKQGENMQKDEYANIFAKAFGKA